jgi:sulfane dehydrogenase subunit SoxC
MFKGDDDMPQRRRSRDRSTNSSSEEPTSRRGFLRSGAAVAGAALSGAAALVKAPESHAAVDGERWQKTPGAGSSAYGQPSEFEKPVGRFVIRPYGDLAPGTGPTMTPIQSLRGTLTPSGLHYIRNHNGTPNIDPAVHRLMIHGMVQRPLIFSVAALSRYPTITRVCFLECSGNSSRALTPEPLQAPAGTMHGLISNSEWTGVPLSLLLEEAGYDRAATWLLAEGADSANLTRSIPMEKALDDAMIALYQNGERLRPEQGYPVRLLLPGWEGNMSVKWLRRLKITNGPTHTKDETSKYTDPLPDGKSLQFTYEMGVKSIITYPSPGMTIEPHSYHEISGIAWSGAGRITRVEVSTDSGASWNDAVLHGQHLSKSVVRFQFPWEWHGTRQVIMSRATDEKGHVQPGRQAWLAQYHADNRFHNNGIASWAIEEDGSVKNVYV